MVVNADGGTGGHGTELGRTFVVADLPGLIEGASQGAGLGIRFLRHVERTRLLVHLIDTSDTAELDPVKAFKIIKGELAAFSEKLLEKPVIVVATKLDATTDRTKLDELRKFCKTRGLEFHAISAAAGEGLKELVRAIANALDRLPKEALGDDEGEVREVGEENGVEDRETHVSPGEGSADDDEAEEDA